MINIFACQSCSRVFNQNSRKPILLPCNDTVCLECAEKKILSDVPDDQILQPLKCCINSSHTFESLSTEKVNNFIFRQISDKAFLTIVCDDHPNMFAKYFCNECRYNICEICVTLNHKTHKGNFKGAFSKLELEAFLSKSVNDFDSTMKKLQSHFDQILNVKQNNVLKDKDFRRSFQIVNQFLSMFCNLDKPIPYFKSRVNNHSGFQWQPITNSSSGLQLVPSQIANSAQQWQTTSVSNSVSQPSYQNRQNQNPFLGVFSQPQQSLTTIPSQSRPSQNQNSIQSLPQMEQAARVQDSQNQVVQSNQVVEELKSSTESVNERTAPTILKPRYEYFVSLVDTEVYKQVDSVLADAIPNIEDATFKLIYQGTRDGFTTAQLQKKLESQVSPNNITFILSNHGQVFGGYSSVKRTFPEHETNIYDKKAFMFQLYNEKVMIVDGTTANKYLAVTHKSDYLCSFGQSNLKISSNCNTDQNQCYSYLNKGFMLPEELRSEVVVNPGSDCKEEQEQDLEHVNFDNELVERRFSYMAGARRFTVEEIEIYEIEYPEDS
eukprot:403376581